VEILADLAGIDVSPGWVITAGTRMAAAIEPADKAIKDAIADAPVAHLAETVTPGCPAQPSPVRKQTPARHLALRLRDRKIEFLRFATDFSVALSNNVAERAVRMFKFKPGSAVGLRTLKGSQTFLTIRGNSDHPNERPPRGHCREMC
jgi:hypothetical protein